MIAGAIVAIIVWLLSHSAAEVVVPRCTRGNMQGVQDVCDYDISYAVPSGICEACSSLFICVRATSYLRFPSANVQDSQVVLGCRKASEGLHDTRNFSHFSSAQEKEGNGSGKVGQGATTVFVS